MLTSPGFHGRNGVFNPFSREGRRRVDWKGHKRRGLRGIICLAIILPLAGGIGPLSRQTNLSVGDNRGIARKAPPSLLKTLASRIGNAFVPNAYAGEAETPLSLDNYGSNEQELFDYFKPDVNANTIETLKKYGAIICKNDESLGKVIGETVFETSRMNRDAMWFNYFFYPDRDKITNFLPEDLVKSMIDFYKGNNNDEIGLVATIKVTDKNLETFGNYYLVFSNLTDREDIVPYTRDKSGNYFALLPITEEQAKIFRKSVLWQVEYIKEYREAGNVNSEGDTNDAQTRFLNNILKPYVKNLMEKHNN